MAINTDKLLNKSLGRLAMQKAQQEKMVGGASVNIVLTKKSIKNVDIIKTNVVKIESILKGTLALDKKQLDDKKRDASKKRKEKIETKLETKPNAESGKISMPTAPRMGILDFIKNFIGNVLLGYFAIRLIKHLPKIMPIVKFLGNAADFIIDVGGKLLNGLVSFIDWGYKAYDATRGFIKNLGGENFAKGFDKFLGAIDTALFLTTALATSLAIDAVSGDGGPGIMDMFGKKGAAKAAGSAAKGAGTAAKGAGVGAGAVAGIVAGAGLLASALGEGAFQLRKIATKPIQDAQKAFDNERNPLMKIGRGALLGGMYTLLGPLSAVGVLLDIVGAPFRYAIELLRFPFLSEEDKVKQANNLAKFDARIRDDFRKALNVVTLGFAFKEKGSFGNIYGNKGSQKEMMGKMQGGGLTRGGKSQRGARRTISKGKYKRVLAPQKPTKTELKSKAFTEDKILKESTEQLDKTKYFGPILAVSSKIMSSEEPTQRDYQNVGLGINMLISQGIQQQQLKGGIVAAFAGGGLVDPDVLSAIETGGDISNWVAKTFRGEVESNAQKTMRMIREMREKKKIPGVDGSGGPEEEQYPPGLGGPSNAPDVPGTASAKFKFIYELARKAGDPFPEVTAAQSIQEAGYNLSQQHTGKFNIFGQTGRHPTLGGVTLGTPRDPGGGSKTFMNFASYEEAAKFRVRRWVPQYGNAATPYEALMNIQKHGGTGRYAQGFPTRAFPQGDWMAYVTSVSNIIKRNGMDPNRKRIPGQAPPLSPPSASMPVTTGAQSLSRGTITSYFGSKEGFRKKAHEGVDIGLNQGTPLSFKMKGTVIDSFRTSSTDREAGGGYGSYMDVKFENGQILRLAHLSKIYPHKKFEPGNVVGLSGGTPGYPGSGRSGGPHLHLEQHSSKIGLEETLKGKLDPIKYGGFGLVQTGGVIKKFALGGRIHKPIIAMIGEKGPEFVFDADTTAGLDRIAPQLLEKLNIAKTKPQLSGILQSYAPYDAMSQQTIIVPTPSGGGDNSKYNNSSASGGVAFMPIGGGGDDPFATLYQGG